MDLHEFAQKMPKAELHVHLEGAIRPATLLKLAERNQIDLPARDEAGLRELYHFHDFDHFIQTYFTVQGCLRTADDFQLIAYEFGADCARQNIRYVEATFTIETNMRLTGLAWREILGGLNHGRAQALEDFAVEMRWIFDIVRDLPESQSTVLEIALAARELGCVALGLGGSEADFPPDLFVSTFEHARQAGLARVLHAGEVSGPPSVWVAIDQLHADRIAHGVRSIEDPRLIEELALRQIPLDVCPTSNICLGVYPDYNSHPFRELWDYGLMVTIGSDDPPMFGTDLVQEYQVLIDHFGFDLGELEQVSLNGISASMLPIQEKRRLEAEFRKEFISLREELG